MAAWSIFSSTSPFVIFLERSYLKRHGTAPPGLLISIVGGALYMIAVYGVLTKVIFE
jgi:hypothetical protein